MHSRKAFGLPLRVGRRNRCLGAALLGAGALAAALAAFASETDFVAPPEARDRTPLQENLVGLQAALLASPLLGALPAQAYAYKETVQASQAAASSAASADSQLPLLGGVVLVALAAFAALAFGGDSTESVDDKKVVKEYFNNEGFERWQKIYGEKDDVNPVQKDIRVGHGETVDKILKWLDPATIAGKSVCDAGCGTGNLSIPLASRGAIVSGSDISSAMVGEAEARAKVALAENQIPKFATSDLEALDGKYDTVCCVDVLIHYPPDKMAGMVRHLAGLSKDRLILSFAPKTWYYTALKRVGELFPGKSKTTRAYLHEEELVEAALVEAGYEVTRRDMTATNFYFSRLLEAKPVATAA